MSHWQGWSVTVICGSLQSGPYKSDLALSCVGQSSVPRAQIAKMCFTQCSGLLLVLLFATAHWLPSTRAQSSFFPVRTFAFTSDTSLHLDLNLVIPIPVLGNVTVDIEVDLPLQIRFMNSSVYYHPVKIPYFILPDPKPITIDLSSKHKPKPKPNYYSYSQDPYSYDSYYAPEYSSPYYESSEHQTWIDSNRRNLLTNSNRKRKKNAGKRLSSQEKARKSKKYPKLNKNGHLNSNRGLANLNETFHYYHRRHRRSVAEASAQHRLDLFSVLEETLNMYGIDGQACVCRAVCELAEMELLIESPVHEVVEHIFRVSRAVDSDGLLAEYVEAEKYGHRSFQDKKWDACAKRYEQCPFSIFDRSSVSFG